MIIFRIKEVRKKNKISLKQLSKETEISRPYLFDLENNRRTNPTLKTLSDIANALDVNIKDLFYTTLDINNLKEKMYKSISENGTTADETIEISQLIDLLINIKMKEELNK